MSFTVIQKSALDWKRFPDGSLPLLMECDVTRSTVVVVVVLLYDPSIEICVSRRWRREQTMIYILINRQHYPFYPVRAFIAISLYLVVIDRMTTRHVKNVTKKFIGTRSTSISLLSRVPFPADSRRLLKTTLVGGIHCAHRRYNLLPLIIFESMTDFLFEVQWERHQLPDEGNSVCRRQTPSLIREKRL